MKVFTCRSELWRERWRGFTLVETLVATSLLALLSVMVLATLRGGFRVWDRSDQAKVGSEDVSFAQDRLRGALEAAYPVLSGTEPGVAFVNFSGTATELKFVTVDLQSNSETELREVRCFIASGRKGNRLVEEMYPIGRSYELALVETLLDDIEGVDFAFMRSDHGQWQESWIDQPRLPYRVRVSLRMPKSDKRIWPQMVIEPKISVDLTCRFDPLTGYCVGRQL